MRGKASNRLVTRIRTAFSAALVLSVILLLGEGAARAAASARLFYGKSPGVESCADEAELRRAIAVRVGYDPIFPIAPNSVAVWIARRGDTIVAEVRLINREGVLAGSRTLRAPAADCGQLTDTIALTVAIALDTIEKATPATPADAGPPPESSSTVDNPPTDPTPTRASTETPTPSMGAASSAEPTSDRVSGALGGEATDGPRLEFGAGMAGLVGISPALSIGPTASVSLRWTHIEIGIEGLADLPASSGVDVIPGASVRTSFSAAGPTACLRIGVYFGCAINLVGSFHAEASGATGTKPASTLDWLTGLRAGLGIPLVSGLSVRASLDLLANPLAPQVHAAGHDLWDTWPVAAATQIGMALQIP